MPSTVSSCHDRAGGQADWIKPFHVAAERIVTDPRVSWPESLRVKKVVSAPQIGEMT